MSESNELVTTNQGGELAAPQTFNTGLDNVARLRPTNLVLIQNTTRDKHGAHAGQILDVALEEAFDRITVVPLFVGKSRVMFPPGELDLDAKPICRSSNGLYPHREVTTPQCGNCASCPKSQWVKIQGKSIKPPCQEKWRFLLIDKETQLPRFFSVGGKSITSARLTLERIQQDIQIKKQRKGLYLSLFDYQFTITSEEVKGRQGVFYVAKFEQVKQLQTPGEFGPFYEQFVLPYRNGGVEMADEAEGSTDEVIDAEVVQSV